MLLTISVLATAIVGAIGFQSGRASLRASVFERLTALRDAVDFAMDMQRIVTRHNTETGTDIHLRAGGSRPRDRGATYPRPRGSRRRPRGCRRAVAGSALNGRFS